MRKIVIFIFMMILCSCTEKKTVLDDNQILLKVENSPNSKIFKSIFELEAVLPIETTDEYLISDNLSRVIRYKEKLFILDNKSNIIIVNASTGKAENLIRYKGNGPGESNQIMDIAIDEDNDNILVFNDYQKLVYYDMQGTFLKEERFEKLYANIIYDKGNILFYNNVKGYSSYPYSIDVYSLNDKTMKIIGDNERYIPFSFRLYGRPIVKSKNIWFGNSLDFDVCRFIENKIEKAYRLNTEMPVITEDKLDYMASHTNLLVSEMTKGFMFGISSIRETEHFLMFISKSEHNGFFILNKTTNEIFWEEDPIDETDLGKKLRNYFPHDGDDNRIMFVIPADEWVLYEKLGKRATTDNLSKELKDKIKSMNITEDDNPILLFYREKKQ
jgi:hypothetical protein